MSRRKRNIRRTNDWYFAWEHFLTNLWWSMRCSSRNEFGSQFSYPMNWSKFDMTRSTTSTTNFMWDQNQKNCIGFYFLNCYLQYSNDSYSTRYVSYAIIIIITLKNMDKQLRKKSAIAKVTDKKTTDWVININSEHSKSLIQCL